MKENLILPLIYFRVDEQLKCISCYERKERELPKKVTLSYINLGEKCGKNSKASSCSSKTLGQVPYPNGHRQWSSSFWWLWGTLFWNSKQLLKIFYLLWALWNENTKWKNFLNDAVFIQIKESNLLIHWLGPGRVEGWVWAMAELIEEILQLSHLSLYYP